MVVRRDSREWRMYVPILEVFSFWIELLFVLDSVFGFLSDFVLDLTLSFLTVSV